MIKRKEVLKQKRIRTEILKMMRRRGIANGDALKELKQLEKEARK